MNLATKKWVFLKLSSIILVPLMFWFIINFISIYDGDYSEVVSFFSNKTNKFIFSMFLTQLHLIQPQLLNQNLQLLRQLHHIYDL